MTEFNTLQTPYKYGLPVVEPSGLEGAFDRLGVDAPSLFRHNGRTYMTHIGFDGIGYRTALCVAEDDDLLHWRSLGVILGRGEPGAWDEVGRAGTCVLCDPELRGDREAVKVNGKYWLFYHAYPGAGYETGAAEIGLAWTEDEELLDWHCLKQPVYSWRDGDAWEHGGLYKCHVIPAYGRYYMFYNAKDVTRGEWREQTGAAVSQDLLHWERAAGNPCLAVRPGKWDGCFCSDPQVFWDEVSERWVMFYFGFDMQHAQEGVAVSDDLTEWHRQDEPLLRNGRAGEIDETHAHKPGVIWHCGVLYHFYCAVRPVRDEAERAKFGGEYRCITLARSKGFEDGRE